MLATCGVYFVWTNPVQVGYEGKIVFDDEQSYTEFKQVIGREDIEINDILVLSSDPPIVVQYDIDVPSDVEFPYGDFSPNIVAAKLAGSSFMALGGLAGLFLLVVHRTKWFCE
jgi:hypothetical protein